MPKEITCIVEARSEAASMRGVKGKPPSEIIDNVAVAEKRTEIGRNGRDRAGAYF